MLKNLFENKGLKIIVIDDTEEEFMLINLAFLKSNLVKEVSWMKDGAMALEFLNDQKNLIDNGGRIKPIIIFLDLNMPRMSGFEVLEKIRSHTNSVIKKLPIIIFSSSCSRSDINQGYLQGANMFVTKPSTYPDLIKFVENFLKAWTEFCALPV